MKRILNQGWRAWLAAGVVALLIGVNLPASLAQTTPAPILVVVNDAASYKYGRYLGEILRAEGLNSFDVLDLGLVTASTLSQRAVVILAQTALLADQATTFANYVSGGGRLIALRPDAQIKPLFGLGAAAGTLNDGYLWLDGAALFNGSAPAAGLASATLQIHGAADQYGLLPGATVIAQL